MENTYKKRGNEKNIQIHALHAQHPELYAIRCDGNGNERTGMSSVLNTQTHVYLLQQKVFHCANFRLATKFFNSHTRAHMHNHKQYFMYFVFKFQKFCFSQRSIHMIHSNLCVYIVPTTKRKWIPLNITYQMLCISFENA